MTGTSSISSPAAIKARSAIGAMFFSCFGAAWLMLWCQAVLPSSPQIMLLPVVGGAGLLALAIRQFRQNKEAHALEADSPEQKRVGRIFNIVNVAQWVVIIVLMNLLNNTGLSAWVYPMAIFVIGVHFLPLAVVFKARRHFVTGIGMVLLASAYPFVASGGPGDPVGLLGAGLVLWASALTALLPLQTAQRATV